MGWDCWKQMGCRWKYYQSQLKKSLKNNLNAFEKESLLQDAFAAAAVRTGADHKFGSI